MTHYDINRCAAMTLDMGTRNVTMVILDQEIKVAQYGQWDGYPTGQGKTVLNFLIKYIDKLDLVKEKMRKLSFLTNEELQALGPEWKESYPYLGRDTAAWILNEIMEGNITKLKDDSEFAAESLMCEWAYVVDLDNTTFEVYKGFNKTELTEKDRFYMDGIVDEQGYYPVKLLAKYELEYLPSIEEFHKLEVNDEEE